MDQCGMNFTMDGKTMTVKEVEQEREKRGECLTCGQKCFKKGVFQTVPLTTHGLVLNGRCLICKPLKVGSDSAVLDAAVKVATNTDMRKYEQTARRHTLRPRTPRAGSATSRNSAGSRRQRGSSTTVTSVTSSRRMSTRSLGQGAKQASGEEKLSEVFEKLRQKKDIKTRIELDAPPKIEVGVHLKEEEEEKANAAETAIKPSLQQMSKRLILGNKMIASNRSFLISQASQRSQKDDTENKNSGDIGDIFKRNSSTASQSRTLYRAALADIARQKLLTNLEERRNEQEKKTEQEPQTTSTTASGESVASSLEESENSAPYKILYHLDKQNYKEIISVMSDHSTSQLIQLECLKDLSNLQKCNDLQSEDYNRVSMTIQRMNEYKDNHEIICQACAAIGNLSSLSTQFQNAFIQCNAIHAVNTVMTQNANDSKIQQNAIFALRSICMNDNEKMMVTVKSGGLDNILQAMLSHRDDVEVQEQGCRSLSAFAVNAFYKQMIGAKRGIDLLIRAVWVHDESQAVVEWGFSALSLLSVYHANKSKLVEKSGIPAVVKAMKKHMDESNIQGKGCNILACAATLLGESKLKIIKHGAVDAVIESMLKYPDFKWVQERGCRMLRNVSTKETIDMISGKNNWAEVLQVAKTEFPTLCEEKVNFIFRLQLEK